MKTPRQRLHLNATERLVRQLCARGCRVERIAEPGGVDLEVVGPDAHRHTIAVRASRYRTRPHAVTVGRKRYTYRYRGAFWNLHQHSQRVADPDVWVLIAGDETYLVPASVLAGRFTVSLMDVKRPQNASASVRPYRDRWDLVTGERRRHAA